MTTTNPAPPALMVEHHDPATLLVDHNIRALRLDKGLVDSIRDLGVLQPVIGYRTIDRRVRVRYGHRRTLAAVEAGATTVPVIVVASEDDSDDIERVVGQYAENTHRDGLNAAEQAGVVTQLLDLGLTAGQIQKRTRMPKTSITAAKAVRGSVAAIDAAGKHDYLTLDQAAAVAEFDGDPDAVKQLVTAAEEGSFRHTLQELRDDRAEQESRAAYSAGLEAAGVTVVSDRPSWQQGLPELVTADGEAIRPETHQDCPGHIAFLHRIWSGDGYAWNASYYCAHPAANGHRKRTYNGTAAQSTEDAKAERALTIAGNKKWRTAETVRREWLTEFLARKEAPKDALRFIIESLARADNALRHSAERSYAMPHQLLGLPRQEPENGFHARNATDAVVDAIAHASDARAAVMGLGIILGAYEETTGVHIWRSPRAHPEIGRYFTALASWGYELAEIEQTVIDGKP
jgi:ParB family transcriptional regulator, chromosome partitioning protein